MSWPPQMILSLLVIVAAYAGGLIAKRVVCAGWRAGKANVRRLG